MTQEFSSFSLSHSSDNMKPFSIVLGDDIIVTGHRNANTGICHIDNESINRLNDLGICDGETVVNIENYIDERVLVA